MRELVVGDNNQPTDSTGTSSRSHHHRSPPMLGLSSANRGHGPPSTIGSLVYGPPWVPLSAVHLDLPLGTLALKSIGVSGKSTNR